MTRHQGRDGWAAASASRLSRRRSFFFSPQPRGYYYPLVCWIAHFPFGPRGSTVSGRQTWDNRNPVRSLSETIFFVAGAC
jgi:hypothetical protein